MKFFATALALSSALLASAATTTSSAAASTATGNANPFNIPTDFSGTAGSTLTLSWTPTTSGTVSLLLRQGASSDLTTASTIASDIANSGSYAWLIPADTVRGTDYAVEIVSAEGDNYTPYFVIESDVTVASTTASTSGTAATTSGAAASGSATSSAAATTTSSGSLTTTASLFTLTGTASSSATTGTTSGAASFQSTSTKAATGAAPRATAAAGVMGLVALGALAL